MLHLDDVQLFVELGRSGSISAAGRRLGLSPAAASAALKRLEQRLETQLFERSTRSLRLTQAGEDFLGYCSQSLELLQEGQAVLHQGREGLGGDLHLGAPSDLGRGLLDEMLEPFRARHPRIRLVVHLSDGLHDLYRHPVDLVLRYGEQRDSSLVALRLHDAERVVCAAPAYLARRGRPGTVEELAQHNCLCFYRNGELYDRWRLVQDGHAREVRVDGDRAADDSALVRQWMLAGHGIGYRSRLDVRADLQAGRLVELFPGAQGERTPLFAVCPSRRYRPARLQALLRHLQEAFASLS